MTKYYASPILLLIFLLTASVSAQTIYYSKANATDFNDVNSWGTAEDGTGTHPASISNANEFIITNGSVMALTGDATVRRLTINSGSLTVSAFTLNLERPFTKQSKLIIDGGTLNVTGGLVNVGGSFHHLEGQFSQSGGSIVIDPNYFGSHANSSNGFQTIPLKFSSSNPPNLTGGTITIVDPPVIDFLIGIDTPAIFYNGDDPAIASPNHTLKLGNGVSVDSGGTQNQGFILDTGGDMTWGNVEVYGPSANSRYINGGLRLTGSLTVHPNAEINPDDVSVIVVGGNVDIMPGGKIMNIGIHFAMPQSTSSVTNTNPQTFTVHDGAVVAYPAENPKTNLWTLSVNNSSAEGVTFAGTSPIAGQPAGSLSFFGGMNLLKGKVSGTGGISSFILGSASSSIEGDFPQGGFAPGTIFGRWYSNTLGGIEFVPGTDGLATDFFTFPFVDNTGLQRKIYIDRVNPVNAQGIIAITYNHVAGTTPVNVTDFTATPNYTVNLKANDSWSVSTLAGTPLAADSFKVQIVAPGLFGGTLTSPNTRVIQGENFAGTHQLGTATPGGHRLDITAGQLTAAPFTLAINSDDVLGTEDFGGDGFVLYPNPVQDVLNVSYRSVITSVKIYNQLGQQVIYNEINAPEAAIDMSGLAKGLYIVNVIAGSASETIKVLKK